MGVLGHDAGKPTVSGAAAQHPQPSGAVRRSRPREGPVWSTYLVAFKEKFCGIESLCSGSRNQPSRQRTMPGSAR